MTVETIRRHCLICDDEVEMPADTLDGMAQAPELIAEAVHSGAPPTEGWSAAEVAAHLADTEVADGWRLRQILSEDRPTLQPFDQEDWADALRYGERKPDLSLLAYATQRTLNVEILSRLSDDQWQRRFHHPEFGEATLGDLVRHISDHDLAHLRQIQGRT